MAEEAHHLREAFLGALTPAQRAEAAVDAGLAEGVAASLAEARRDWFPVLLAGDTFAAYIASHLRQDIPVAEAFAELRAGDLYIACACALGDNAAIRLFERELFGELDALWPSFRDRVGHDDARQMLRQKLFLRSDTAEAKILKFAGRGDIRGWVRVVAGRMLVDLTDKVQRERPVEDAFFDKVGTGVDLELDRFKAQYGAEFKEAFRLAVESLSTREKSLLRHAYVKGASVVEIGAAYGVHGATAARWVAAARQKLVRSLRKTFAERLKVTNAELESVLRLIESTANVTLERYFKELHPTTT